MRLFPIKCLVLYFFRYRVAVTSIGQGVPYTEIITDLFCLDVKVLIIRDSPTRALLVLTSRHT
jgi:hypothetical protein